MKQRCRRYGCISVPTHSVRRACRCNASRSLAAISRLINSRDLPMLPIVLAVASFTSQRGRMRRSTMSAWTRLQHCFVFLQTAELQLAKLVETLSGTLRLAIVPVRPQQNLSTCGLMQKACFATWSEISSTRILVGSSKSLLKVALKITPHCESTTLVSGPLRKLGTEKWAW